MSPIGNYNPRAPIILGEEWVPIRDENVVYSPAVNSFELGQGFTLAAARTITESRFYLNQDVRTAGQIYMSSIYPAGAEDESGPIRSLIIPVNSGSITGTGITLVSAATVAEAVASAGDGKYVDFANGGSGINDRVVFFFAVNLYPNLQGKRILALNILHVIGGPANYYETSNPQNIAIFPSLSNDAAVRASFDGRVGFVGTTTAANTTPSQLPRVERLELGEVAWFFGTNTIANTTARVPTIYSSLQQMEISATNRYRFDLFLSPSNGADFGHVELSYLALEVIYCDETRVAFGGRHFGSSSSVSNLPYVVGTNTLAMFTTAQVANPALAAGTYVQTLYSANMGMWQSSTVFPAARDSQYPNVNGLRQLYEIPPHPGVRINIPVPLWDHIDEQFDVVQSMILPQLSLRLSTGTTTEPHAYGRQGDAQVWGTNTATQEIYDDIVGVNTTYQQVRYYARRFGDTTIPLKLAGTASLAASTVSIAVADFDALPEILDGWREVTLRFATAPTMGTLASPEPSWVWSAAGEKPGNRWEILAACAPATSGIPGNLFNQVTAVDRLGTATYQPTAGDTVELTWMPQGVASPYVSGATADPGCDAVLIFSIDPPTVTGISLSQLTQTVTGIGLDCGSLPCCIPSGIGYNRITWGLPVNTGVAEDSFTRTVAAGSWGDADIGGTYTLSGTAADFSVNGTQGVVTSSAAADRFAVLPAGVDFDVTVDAAVSTVPGGSARPGAVGRYTDANNNYTGRYEVDSAGAVIISIIKRVAGVLTVVATYNSQALAGASGAFLTIRFMGQGTLLKLKVWKTGEPEPAMWDLEATDTSLTTGTLAGIYTRDITTTNTYLFDNLKIGPPAYWFGALELQRFDALDPTGDFQTIMLATDPATTSFNDYEARVGINSVYRIRNLNAYNFAGAWSTQVTGAPPTPGVTGACPDMTGALIFTSNADQTGESNAAYIMQWEREPSEDFALPEADMVQYQPMYGRDGSVAFHGTERGFETFTRTLLLQAAAISPPRLADASTIRDLAWANLPYVCVRDDLGDRWFASVAVPSVAVRHNRTKYMARVEIVETTATPYPVNPT